MVSHLEAMFPKGFSQYVSCITCENFFGAFTAEDVIYRLYFPVIKFEIG